MLPGEPESEHVDADRTIKESTYKFRVMDNVIRLLDSTVQRSPLRLDNMTFQALPELAAGCNGGRAGCRCCLQVVLLHSTAAYISITHALTCTHIHLQNQWLVTRSVARA